MQKGFIIAIDGPVASGKGTIAPLLAEKLHGFYIDTGMTFRSIALYCLQHTILWDDETAVAEALPKITIDLLEHKVFLNGIDVSEKIRTSEVSQGSSIVSAQGAVRDKAKADWQTLARMKENEGTIVVAEGRDMGTIIFPNAALKLFLTARPEVRAERRKKQFLIKGDQVSLEKVLQDIQERDKRDSTRAISPLTTEPEKYGYFILDNSDITEDQTMAIIVEQLHSRNLL